MNLFWDFAKITLFISFAFKIFLPCIFTFLSKFDKSGQRGPANAKWIKILRFTGVSFTNDILLLSFLAIDFFALTHTSEDIKKDIQNLIHQHIWIYWLWLPIYQVFSLIVSWPLSKLSKRIIRLTWKLLDKLLKRYSQEYAYQAERKKNEQEKHVVMSSRQDESPWGSSNNQ